MATKRASVRSFPTSVDIPAADRTKVNQELNQHLADSFDLLTQVKQARWNVKGPDFWQLHTLPEFPTDITDSMEYVKAVAARLSAFTNSARKAIDQTDKIGDANTADLFTEISRCANKYLYFLEAHLQD